MKITYPFIAASFLLSSCGPIIDLGNDQPPPTLYTIQSELSGSMANEGAVIYVSEPLLPGESIGTRIAVRTNEFELKFLSGGQWSEPFRMMLHRYLVSDLSSSIEAQVVGAGSLDLRADCRLSVDFQRFDYDASSSSIIAKAMARLSSLKSGALLTNKLIDVRADISSDSSDEIVSGYNQAAKLVSADLGSWLKEALPDCGGAD